MPVAPAQSFTCRPLWPLSEPAEVKVDPRRVERPAELRGCALGPAERPVFALAETNEARSPSGPLCQRSKIDLTGGDRGRFPIDGEDLVAAQKNGLRVELPVDD